MKWSVDTYEGHPASGGYETWHRGDVQNHFGDPVHQLVVKYQPKGEHWSGKMTGTHTIRLDDATGTTRFHFPSEQHPDQSHLLLGPGKPHYLPPPSDMLRSMIEAHHRHAGDDGAWMQLLDKLVEEYPHLTEAAERHTAARFSA